MPIKHAIWSLTDEPAELPAGRLTSEHQLEEMIVKEPRILSNEWMLIGRQEPTSYNGRIDLLAIAPDSSLVLIELKRDRTPRNIVGQALDYATWVEKLNPEKIAHIFQRLSKGGDLRRSFQERFGSDLDEDALNASHQIVIVAAELDDATERIITYLNARGIAINVLFFQVFRKGDEQLLSRAWLIDPTETQANVVRTAKGEEREPWNGEYYVSYGPPTSRSWDDARTYGFISAGGGRWYSQTLRLLSPGDRVWVNLPRKGYVGVGEVIEGVRPMSELCVKTGSANQSALDVLEHGERYRSVADDSDLAEYVVRVRWLDTAPEDQAFNEVGLFGNQNTVCQPTTRKWRHTIERLKARFPRWQG